MNKIFIICFLTITIALQACNGSTLVPTPTQPAATATPAVTSTPTPVVSNETLLQNYTHTNNRFRIKYPQNWEPHERADGVIFIEPGDKAGYSVVFSDAGKAYDKQELNQYLVTFVAQNFAKAESNFKAISQEQLADGSVVAQFASTDSNLGRTINEIKVFQVDTIVYVLHFSTVAEQWEASYPALRALADTFNALDTTPVAKTEPTDEPPLWELIGPESKEFGFFYASNWEVVEQAEHAISVAEPTLNMTFTASNFVWPDTKNDPQAAEKAALAYIEKLSKKHEVQNLPPEEFPLDTATGVTIDFYYTTEDGTPFAGSVITAPNDGKMHQIVFTAPAEPVEMYDVALQWFNPMYKSFKFLEPEDFVEE